MSPFQPRVTLVVLNWQRPSALNAVLEGFCDLRYPNFEVVVVGDRPASSDLSLSPELRGAIRYIQALGPNISQSRNLAVQAARGEIVAFCDDDAIPEPDWLCELVQAFEAPEVGAAGGTVRGPDGISYQWRGAWLDQTGQVEHMDLEPGRAAQIFGPGALRQASFMGVNGAYRRRALLELGGFDESYRYYLDESDMILRLGQAGWSVALVPDAEIVHYQERNATRGRLAKPLNLYEIGASKAHFCRFHARGHDLEKVLRGFHADRRSRLDRYIRIGMLDARDRDRVMAGLESGLRDGLSRGRRRTLSPFAPPVGSGMFQPFAVRRRTATQSCAVIASVRGRRDADARARALRGQGLRVSLFLPTLIVTVPKMSFEDGIWRHHVPMLTAGLARPGTLIAAELARADRRRAFDLVVGPGSNDRSTSVDLARLLPHRLGVAG